jgi:cyanophycinase
MLNFNKQTATNQILVDSLQKQNLFFISGGDQSRFMEVVNNTNFKAIHHTYRKEVISGTSAGAAVMCEHMITGSSGARKRTKTPSLSV